MKYLNTYKLFEHNIDKNKLKKQVLENKLLRSITHNNEQDFYKYLSKYLSENDMLTHKVNDLLLTIDNDLGESFRNMSLQNVDYDFYLSNFLSHIITEELIPNKYQGWEFYKDFNGLYTFQKAIDKDTKVKVHATPGFLNNFNEIAIELISDDDDNYVMFESELNLPSFKNFEEVKKWFSEEYAKEIIIIIEHDGYKAWKENQYVIFVKKNGRNFYLTSYNNQYRLTWKSNFANIYTKKEAENLLDNETIEPLINADAEIIKLKDAKSY